MGDATDLEHDTEEAPGGDDIDTEKEPVIPLTQKDQGVNNHTR